MGITIHYEIKVSGKNKLPIPNLLEKMRQLALDLPFEKVDDKVKYVGPDVFAKGYEYWRNIRDNEREWRWVRDLAEEKFRAVVDNMKFLRYPWCQKNSCYTHDVMALEAYVCNLWPGPGSEYLSLTLARWPETAELEYRVEHDRRFWSNRFGRPAFDWRKFDAWTAKIPGREYDTPRQFCEIRHVPTKLRGWTGQGFCKTEYASDPRCGGMPNFLRCHISVVTLLERIGRLPGVKVVIDDEGGFGENCLSQDYEEARAAGRDPTYVQHNGHHNVDLLLQSIGESNAMLAATFGSMKDSLPAGQRLESPIMEYPNFEKLEFKGCQAEQLQPFLQAMSAAGAAERAKHKEEGSATS